MAVTGPPSSQQSLSKFFTKRKQERVREHPSSSPPRQATEKSKSPPSKRQRLIDGQPHASTNGEPLIRRQYILEQLKLNGGNVQDDLSKRQRHALYVQRLKISNVLPSPATSSSPPAGGGEDTPLDEDNNGEDQEEEEEKESELSKRFAAPASRSSKKGAKRRKFTPLEQQVIQLKQENPGTILMIEVGYKYRFFGQDAAVASKELNIFLVPGWMNIQDADDSMYTKFASASIPVQRLHVHVRRLINKGYRVGVVRQIETAAIKAAGANKSAPFERKLTDLFTKGTYVDEVSLDGFSDSSRAADKDNNGSLTANSASKGVLCISEESSSSNDNSIKVGIIAVRPDTGDVIYDSFIDGFSRGELETRILHIQPAELVIVGDLSKYTEKLISHVVKSFSFEGAKVRVERLPRPDVNESQTFIREFYGSSSCPGVKNETLEVILNLPASTTGVCLSTMIEVFKKFGLEHVFTLLSTFRPFLGRSHMLLNGNTISNLEIFYNSADRCERGSLFWLLNNTRTKFGERVLKRWVGQPLVNREELEKRSDAVDEIINMSNKSTILTQVKELLTRMIDLEKGLVRIHYGRCSRKELLFVLRGFDKTASTFCNRKWTIPEDVGFRSPILNQAIFILPKVKSKIQEFLGSFNHTAALYENKTEFFDDSKFAQIEDINYSIEQVNQELTDHIVQVREILQKPHLEYVSVGNEEFLIEVRNNADVKRVPKDWIKISGTRVCSRFHTPRVRSLLRELERLRETLNLECDRAYREFQEKVAGEYQMLRSIVDALATLDCLMSLAETGMQPDYIKPVYVDEPCIEIEEGRHPMVEMLLANSFIANDVSMGSHKELRAMIITGPNMGGKSSYVRQVALLAIMGQIGSYVPAKKARLGMLDAVFTRMGAYDNMLSGESTFMVELNECSEIITKASARSLVILDEIGRGTGTMDGVAIAYGVLDYFISVKKSLTLFVTHYPSLAIFARIYKGLVDNFHMGFIQNNEDEDENDTNQITFLYKLVHGPAHKSYGFNVARLANLPPSLVTLAAAKARQLEQTVHDRQNNAWTLRARKQLDLVLSGSSSHSCGDLLVQLTDEIDNI